jgi:hypothetical protein
MRPLFARVTSTQERLPQWRNVLFLENRVRAALVMQVDRGKEWFGFRTVDHGNGSALA